MTAINYFYNVRVCTKATIDAQFDCVVSVPFANIRYQEMNIGLASKTLSDSFSCVTYTQLYVPNLDDTVEGSVGDYDYSFKVDELTVSNYQLSMNGRYDKDAMLFTKQPIPLDDESPYFFGLNRDGKGVWSPKEYINGVSTVLGLTPRSYCRDWAVAPDSMSSRATYQQHLQSLFGWLSSLPCVDVNCFIRGNYLYTVQRGHEWDVIDDGYGMEVELLNNKHVQFAPTRNAKRIRTESNLSVNWPKNAAPENAITDKAEPVPFTGVIEFGEAKLEYVDGYLMERVEGTKITRYEYDFIFNDKKYLSKEESVDTEAETANKTEYHYQQQGEVLYLYEEERWTGGEYRETAGAWDNDYSDAVKVVTTRSPLGNSWYGVTTTNEDTEEVMTSLTQGSPASEANRYMIELQQNALTAYSESNNDLISLNVHRILDKLLGSPLISTNWPVDSTYGLENGDFRWLADWTDKLNGAVESTVTMTVYDYKDGQGNLHIIDFTDMIKYEGVYYCLQSNNVSHTPEGIRQDLTLVRWYRSDWCIPVPRVGE